MAYIILENNNLTAIAADDNAKDALNIPAAGMSVIDISNEDFEKIRTNTFSVSTSGDTYSLTDLSESLEGASIDETTLKLIHQDVIKLIDELEKNDPTNALISQCTSYRTYLKNLDYSSLPLPLDKPWEKYCEDNSITYIHPLQIP
jgi:hypothetical protein|tara:strand:+ start:1231 stop:1668 length:438 start_codon:yes stop_codon:yes gene_type:complete